jgi:hypothetical protein
MLKWHTPCGAVFVIGDLDILFSDDGTHLVELFLSSDSTTSINDRLVTQGLLRALSAEEEVVSTASDEPGTVQRRYNKSQCLKHQLYSEKPGTVQPKYNKSQCLERQLYSEEPSTVQPEYNESQCLKRQHFSKEPGTVQPKYNKSQCLKRQHYSEEPGTVQPKYNKSQCLKHEYSNLTSV